MIQEKDIKQLAELARIKISDEEEKKLLSDLERIINYFDELKEIKVKDLDFSVGGTFFKNAYRKDEERDEFTEGAREAFPESSDGLLKIPPVFN